MAHLIRYPLPRPPVAISVVSSQIISVLVFVDTPINVPTGTLNLVGFIPVPVEDVVIKEILLVMAPYQPV